MALSFEPEPPPRLAYSVAEVAYMLGVSERTIWRWRRKGVFKTIVMDQTTMIPCDEVRKLLASAA